MTTGHFVEPDRSPESKLAFWDPIVFTAEVIEAEVERLTALPQPLDGRRESRFVHPRSSEPGLGLAPGIDVTLSVLLPGERTSPRRHNSTNLNFCVRGSGFSVIDGNEVHFQRYDVWNTPSYRWYVHVNDTDDPQVRLTYSNSPVLEKLYVHLVENGGEQPPDKFRGAEGSVPGNPDESAGSDLVGPVTLDDGSTLLVPYEQLINPAALTSSALHWPWDQVRARLNHLESLGAAYAGRRLYLLYNPLTGRTNGTTPSFFATMTLRPPGIVDQPHRHVSAAINYFFEGAGWSRIGGRRYEWKAGDLMFTAPGWMVHHHASDEHGIVYELTVQDQPFHIGLESLLWQEDLSRPPRLLGVDAGFATNRGALDEAPRPQ